MIRVLSIGEVAYVAYTLAKKWMDWDEPIPHFSTRFPNKLESCLGAPFQTFGKRELYKGFAKKAATLFYFLIKNHPFQNGNKRIAVTCLLTFLYKNGKWLRIDSQELYNFAIWVAESPAAVKDQTIQAVEFLINKYIISRSS